MSFPVLPHGFLGAQGDSDTYRIERSLRFNSADSAYLSRTPASAGNRKTWTWSGWVKKTKNADDYPPLFNAGTSAPDTVLRFSDTDTLTAVLENGGGGNSSLNTTQVFRDPSSWYHIVWAVDTTNATANDRNRLYVNGTEITNFGTRTNPSQNLDTNVNNTVEHKIGAQRYASYFNGYLTEINFIDGQALTPSSFGETDAITGRWKAKAYSGTYGTNGFYLSFKDNTSTTTLGYDDAGSNDWTLNNFSVTAGAGNDSLVDSPTNYGTDTGLGGEVRGNYATLNPLSLQGASLSNGNLECSTGGVAPSGGAFGNFAIPSTGKWYWEFTPNDGNGFDSYSGISVAPASNSPSVRAIYYGFNGDKEVDGVTTAYGSAYGQNDVIGVAVNSDAGSVTFYKNNVSQGAITYSLANKTIYPWFADGSSARNTSFVVNFGQRPFAYTAPSGFKALCTQNLAQPTIQKPSSAMDVVTYTGTGASQSISSLGFSPDLVWIKGRSGATDHALYDTTRGVQQDLGSNLTTDETTQAQGLTAFGTNGFTIGTLAKLNTNTSTYVAWAWDESAINGLDIVSYTGNGTARTISHNLGVAPKMIIVKARTTAGTDQGWPVYHASNTAAPETDYLLLNSTAQTADLDTVWNDTAPTASVFSVGTNALVNTNNDTYIAYLFSEVEGFSKFGSYTGNGSSDGPFVWCGFRPRWVMVKRSDAADTQGWLILDSARNTINPATNYFSATNANAEASVGSNYIDIVSSGFKFRFAGADGNVNGGTYIFAAFAESAFKYSRAR